MAETPESGRASETTESQEEEAPPAEAEAESDEQTPTPGSLASEIDDEVELGDSDIGKDANKALRSLARSARSFLMYDPGNEAIKIFLKQMHEDFHYFLGRHGAMALAVRPFEMVIAREVVYLERDRERSLAFKLYRDGVRSIIIRPEVEWEEMLALLKILSVRFVGIRSNEDDIVTLLWKAAFQSIDVHAVEGFVPKDEDEEDSPDWEDMNFNYEDMPMGSSGGMQGGRGGQEGQGEQEEQPEQGEPGGRREQSSALVDRSGQAREAIQDKTQAGPAEAGQPQGKRRKTDAVTAHALRHASNVPPHFDLPAPVFLFKGEPTYLELTEEHLADLQQEIGSTYLPDHCLELIDEFVEIVIDPVDRCKLDEILPLLSEIKDFLLSEGQLENLLLMIGLVSRLIEALGDEARPAQVLLDSMIDKTAMIRYIKTLPRDAMKVPPQIIELLQSVHGDHLPLLFDVHEGLGDSSHGRRIIRMLLEQQARDMPDQVVAHLHERTGEIGADLLRVLGNIHLKTAWQVIDTIAETADAALKNECMYILEKSSYNNTVRGLTFRFLGDNDEDFRIRSIQVLLTHNDRRDFPMLRRHADKAASSRGLSEREATALGEGMAQLDKSGALKAFSKWSAVKGFRKLRLTGAGNHDLQWAAASGLALLDDPKADKLLHALVKIEDPSIRRHSLKMRMARFNRLKEDGDQS